jgi:hypothetical protein
MKIILRPANVYNRIKQAEQREPEIKKKQKENFPLMPKRALTELK